MDKKTKNYIISQLEKLPSDFRGAKIRLGFILHENTISEKLKKIIKIYIETVDEIQKEFDKKIREEIDA